MLTLHVQLMLCYLYNIHGHRQSLITYPLWPLSPRPSLSVRLSAERPKWNRRDEASSGRRAVPPVDASGVALLGAEPVLGDAAADCTPTSTGDGAAAGDGTGCAAAGGEFVAGVMAAGVAAVGVAAAGVSAVGVAAAGVVAAGVAVAAAGGAAVGRGDSGNMVVGGLVPILWFRRSLGDGDTYVADSALSPRAS